MRIKMRQLAAGPAGTWQAGDVVDVDRALGTALCAGGYADAVDVAPPVVEVAVAPAAPEAAVLPRRPGRQRRHP